ncbi:hypothetical protein B0H10DRAFT_2228329 [Mycena sp. CBHHK59/15]|nr:hypothetical protein B0H10DRAFT_2228329 [Mycena sp. CBHHK59/15]
MDSRSDDKPAVEAEGHDRGAQDLGSALHVDKSRDILSIFLTVLELWVALDRGATQMFPLLLDYSPELSAQSFEPLVLPERDQMRRLHDAELYLAKRHERANRDIRRCSLSTISIIASCPIFCTDSELQALRANILRTARREKSQKLEEVQRKNQEHSELLREAGRLIIPTMTDRRWEPSTENMRIGVVDARKREKRRD